LTMQRFKNFCALFMTPMLLRKAIQSIQSIQTPLR
jgi:hypothetical protein